MCYNKVFMYANSSGRVYSAPTALMKGVFLTMRIYQPVRGVGGALRENSFVMIDDAGVEIGQGGLEYRVI
mgnify:FL=1